MGADGAAENSRIPDRLYFAWLVAALVAGAVFFVHANTRPQVRLPEYGVSAGELRFSLDRCVIHHHRIRLSGWAFVAGERLTPRHRLHIFVPDGLGQAAIELPVSTLIRPDVGAALGVKPSDVDAVGFQASATLIGQRFTPAPRALLSIVDPDGRVAWKQVACA